MSLTGDRRITTDVTKRLINESILLTVEHLKGEIYKTSFISKKKEFCECIEILSKAYQNINNEKSEEQNNEKI